MKLYKYNISSFSKEDYDFWYALMSGAKQKRIDGYRNEDDRRRSVCAHMLALKAISEHTPLSVNEIKIGEDKNGKPYCKNVDIHFSLSHADDTVICAVSDKPVGVDIEKIRPIKYHTAKRICSEKELHYIFGDNPTEKDAYPEEVLVRFFEIWVKKEAFGKKEGFGVAYNMKGHDVLEMPCAREGDYIIAVCE